MLLHLCKFVVVEPRSPQSAIIQLEAQWMHKVQRGAGIRANAYYIAGIRGYLRLKQNHIKHTLGP